MIRFGNKEWDTWMDSVNLRRSVIAWLKSVDKIEGTFGKIEMKLQDTLRVPKTRLMKISINKSSQSNGIGLE